MAHIFDGKKISIEKEIEIEREVKKLKKKGIQPKLVTVLVGDDEESQVYLKLKKKVGKKIGVKVEIRKLQKRTSVNQLIKLVEELNNDKSVHGIMVQLPLQSNLRSKTRKIINAITPGKDIDGMRDDSQYLAPVVKAVLKAIKKGSNHIAGVPLKVEPLRVVVVGAKGFIGRKMVKTLKEMDYQVGEVDIETKNLRLRTKKADILISVVGEAGLITGDMVGRDAIVIDVGYPKGDVNLDQVAQKASFITPVPGGIGPVTIAYLFENLIEATKD